MTAESLIKEALYMNKDLIAIFEYLERENGIKSDVVIARSKTP